MSKITSQPNKCRWVMLLRPKVAIPLGLLVLLLLSPVLYRGWNLGHVPDLGDPFSAELLENAELSEAENAWVNYHKARELLVFPSLDTDETEYWDLIYASFNFWGSKDDAEWISLWTMRPEDLALPADGYVPSDLSLLKHYLELNLKAVEEWKTGTTKSRYYELESYIPMDRSIRWDYSADLEYFPLPLHELGIMRAVQLASQGCHREALDWLLAVFRYSRHLTQSGGTANWERAIAIGNSVFAVLDRLLDDSSFTHDDLFSLLHELENCFELTGDFEHALTHDYFTLRQRIIDVYEKGSVSQELIEDDPSQEAGSSVFEQGRFRLYVEGEPQLSLRFLQHHFEYVKRNLEKPVKDRVVSNSHRFWGSENDISHLKKLYRVNSVWNELTLTPDQMEALVPKVGLLREVVELPDFFTNSLLREDDAMLFESLRILIAAHAFARQSPNKAIRDSRFLHQLIINHRSRIEILPVVTMEELIADFLIATPRCAYDSTFPLIITTGPNGEVYIFSSTSVKYKHLANGVPLESIEVSDDPPVSLVFSPTFWDGPQFKYLTFRLPID